MKIEKCKQRNRSIEIYCAMKFQTTARTKQIKIILLNKNEFVSQDDIAKLKTI